MNPWRTHYSILNCALWIHLFLFSPNTWFIRSAPTHRSVSLPGTVIYFSDTRFTHDCSRTRWEPTVLVGSLWFCLLLKCLGVVWSLAPTSPQNLDSAAQVSIVNGLSKCCAEVTVRDHAVAFLKEQHTRRSWRVLWYASSSTSTPILLLNWHPSEKMWAEAGPWSLTPTLHQSSRWLMETWTHRSKCLDPIAECHLCRQTIKRRCLFCGRIFKNWIYGFSSKSWSKWEYFKHMKKNGKLLRGQVEH